MRVHSLLNCLVVACVSASLCPVLSAQSQDVAEAARKAKLKKQQTSPDSSKPAAKSKTYTNDDIPESRAAAQQPSPEKNGSRSESSAGNPKTDDAKTPPTNNSADITVSVPNSTIKHPGGSAIDWSVHNTSDHTFTMTLTLLVTGPCKYRYQTSRSAPLDSGAGYSDNQFGFAVYEDSCPGAYHVELSVSAYGKVLNTATASVTVI
jgi:hypothetical protein